MASIKKREQSPYEKALEKYLATEDVQKRLAAARQSQMNQQATAIKQRQLTEYANLQGSYGEKLRNWGNKQGMTNLSGMGMGNAAVMNAYSDLQNRYNTMSGTGAPQIGRTKADADRNARFMASPYEQALQKLLNPETEMNFMERALIRNMERENKDKYAQNRETYNALRQSYEGVPEGYGSHEEAYKAMMGEDRDSSLSGIWGTDYKARQQEQERLKGYYGERGAFDTMDSEKNGNQRWMTDAGLDNSIRAYELLVEESRQKDEERAQKKAELDAAFAGMSIDASSPRKANELAFKIAREGKSGEASVENLMDISKVYLGIENPDITDPEIYRRSYEIYERMLSDQEGVIEENNKAAENAEKDAISRYERAEAAWNEPYTSRTDAYTQAMETLTKERDRRSKKKALTDEAMADPDFAAKSQGTGKESYVDDYMSMSTLDQMFHSDNDAVLANYIGSDKYSDDYESFHANGTGGESYYALHGYNLLTDEEKQVYTYFYNTQGAEKAQEYLDAIESDLLRRRSEAMGERQTALAENPLMGPVASAVTIPLNLVNGVIMTGAQVAGALSGETDPNSALYSANQMIDTIRQTRGQVWGESWLGNRTIPIINANLGEMAYQTLMSVGDNLMAVGVGKGLAGTAKGVTELTQAIMSTEATSAALKENLDKGMDAGEAVVMAGLSGVIEAATEKYSIEALLSNPASILGYVAKNVLTEGSEEVASTLLNTAADELAAKITGNRSEIKQQYNDLLLKNPGMSGQEATRQVLTEYLQGMGTDFLAGALSGGLMAGGSGIQTQVQRSAVGSDINMTQSGDQLLSVAEAMEEGSESRKLAEKLRKRQTKGRKLSNGAVGQLYQTLYTELDEKGRQTVQQVMADSVEARLTELGENRQTAKEIAPLMMRVVNGEQLSRAERSRIASATYGTRVLNELRFADEETNDGEWAKESRQRAGNARNALYAPMQEFESRRETARAMGQQTDAQERETVQKAEEKAKKLTVEGMEKTRQNRVSLEAVDDDGKRGEVLRMVENKSGGLDVVVKDTEGTEQTVPYDSMSYSGGVARIVSYANASGERMTAQKANLMLHSYTGGDAGAYIRAYNRVYNAGYDGRAMPQVTGVGEKQARVIYDQAQRDGQEAESRRKRQTGRGEHRSKGHVRLSADVNEKTLTNGQRTSIAALSAIARQTGVNFEVFASKTDEKGNYEPINGWYDRTTNTIHIDVNSGKNKVGDVAEYAILRTASHELTHFIENNSKESYAALKAFIVDELARKGLDFDALVQRKQDRSNVKLTREEAMAEVIADGCEMMLKDSEAITRLAQEDGSLFHKVKGFIDNFLRKIRAAFSGVEAQSIEARSLTAMREGARQYVAELQALWDDALVEAAKETRKPRVEITVEKAGENRKFSTREQDQIEEDKYFARKIDRWDGMAAGGRFKLGVIKKGSIYEGIGLPAGELYMDISKAANALQKHGDHLSKNLLKRIPQMLAKPVVITEPINPKLKNTVNVFSEMQGENGRPIMIAIMMKPDRSGSYLVNVVRSIEMRRDVERLITAKSILYVDNNKKRTPNWFQGLWDSNAQFAGTKGGFIRRIAYREGNVNQDTEKQFSLREEVEERSDGLIAVHNMKSEELLSTLDELGGFPSPSIAIVKAKDGHSKYGDVSVVFGKETIDPQTNRKNKVYSQDAWTPEFPEVMRKINEDAYEKLKKRWRANAEKLPKWIADELRKFIYRYTEDATRDSLEEMASRARENNAVKAMYLSEKGRMVQEMMIEEKEELGYDPAQVETYQRLIDRFGDELNWMGRAGGNEVLSKWMEALKEQLPGNEDVSLHSPVKERLKLIRPVREALKYKNRSSEATGRTVVDRLGTASEMDKEISRSREDYDAWVRKELEGVLGQKGVRNGREPFTPGGTKRSFRQLYDDYTLDNIVKAMNRTGKKNATGFGSGNIMAAAAREFGSVEEIRKNRDQLQRMNVEEYETAKKQLEADWEQVVGDVTRTAEQQMKQNLSAYNLEEVAKATLLDCAEKGLSETRMKETLSREGFRVTDDTVKEAQKVFRKAAEMPTEYFEAKPMRAVGMDEVKAVILPESANEKLRERLEQEGVNVLSYDGTEEDRLRKLNQVNNVQFSMREDTIALREYMSNLTAADMRTETERELLRRYQERIEAYREALKRVEEAKSGSGEEQMEAWRQLRKAERALKEYEKDGGIAQMMRQSQRVVDKYLLGKTRAEVESSLETLNEELKELRDDVARAGLEVTQSREKAKNALVRSSFRESDIRKAARELRMTYATSVNANEIGNRLAMIWYTIMSGKGNPHQEIINLATDIVTREKSGIAETNERIRDAMGGQLTLTEGQRNELKAMGIGYRELQSALKGVLKYNPGGRVTLDQHWAELTEQVPELDVDASEGDQIVQLLDLIEAAQTMSREEQLEGRTEKDLINEVAAEILVKMPRQMLEKTDGQTLAALRRMLEKQTAKSEETEKRLQEAEKRLQSAESQASRARQQSAKEMSEAEQVLEYYQSMEKQRRLTELAEQKQLLTRELKSKAAKKVMEAQEKERTRRDLLEGNAAKRRQINRLVKSMDRKIQKGKSGDLVLEAYRPVVEQMIKTFADSESNAAFTPAEAAGISKVYELLLKLDATEDIDVDQDILDDLDEMRTLLEQDVEWKQNRGRWWYWDIKKLQTRNVILNNLAEVVQHFNKIVNDAGTAFVEGKRQRIEVLAEDAAEEMRKRKRKPRRELAGKAGQAARAVDNSVGTGNTTPYYFFRRMNNDVLNRLWQDIRRGQNRYGLRLAEARDEVQEIKSKYDYESWKNAKPLTFTTAQGRTITLDAETAMQLYATWKRETQNELITSTHLENGGFVYSEANQPTEGRFIKRQTGPQSGNKLTQADMKTIEDWLTENMKGYADAMVGYLSTTVGEWGNETSMEQLGIRKYKEAYYIPMEVAGDALQKGSNEGVTDPENRSKNKSRPAKVSRPGFSKTRVQNANKPLVIRGLTQVAEQHINGMITYSSFALPIESMNSVLNAKTATEDETETTLRQVVGETYGRNTIAYIETMLRDLNGGAVTDPAERAWGKMISLFKRGAVQGSLSVAAQQPLSYIRAAAVMNPKYLAEALGKRDAGYLNGAYEEAKRYSGVAVIKEVGRVDMGMGMSAMEYLDGDPDVQMNRFAAMLEGAKRALGAKGYERFKQQWNNALGFLPGKMDEITWGRIWTACKLETAEQNPGMDRTGDAFMRKVAERFNDVIDATQVYDSTLSRSQNMRSNSGLMKEITSFMAEPTVTLNMLADAFVSRGETKKQMAARIGTALAVYAVSAIAQAAAKAPFTAGRKDDEEKTFLEKWMAGFAGNAVGELNPFGLIPGVQDLVTLLRGNDVERADMSVISELINAGKKLGSDNLSTWRKVEDFGGAVAKLAGVPLKNVMRDFRTIGNWFGLPWAAGNADRPTSGVVAKESLGSEIKNFFSMEGLGLTTYETSKAAYYNRLYKALKNGETERAGYYREYLTLGLGANEKAIASGLKAQVKERVLSGEVSKQEAIGWLVEQGLSETEQKAYSLVDGWMEKAEHADEEGYSYSAYNTAVEAALADDAEGVKQAKVEMQAMGYKAKDINSAIRAGIGEKYGNGEIDRKEAEKLLKAYGSLEDVNTYGTDATTDDKVYWTLKKYAVGEEDFSRYDDLYAAVDQGSAAGIRAATMELTAHGSDGDEVTSRIRSYIGSQYKDGTIAEDRARRLMQSFGDMEDSNDLYWTMRQWKAEKKNKDVKGYVYGKYDDFENAVETGRNLSSVIKEYTSHGIEAKTLASQITKAYKDEFVRLYNTNKAAAANLQARLLTAYEALGYSRSRKQRDIQKWLND